jgi:tubulin polyglutamylase TTLL6/13
MLAVKQDLQHAYRTYQPRYPDCCFEILGFDIILNSDLKPFLLEVNHAPSFATDSVLDLDVKKQLLTDTFNILGLTIEIKQQKLLNQHEFLI